MSIETTVDVKPCPFCGTTEDKLFIGANDATSYRVGCECGARVIFPLPWKLSNTDRKGLKELEIKCRLQTPNLTTMQYVEMAMYAYYTLQAIERWNRRA